jgi:hypothetical protein
MDRPVHDDAEPNQAVGAPGSPGQRADAGNVRGDVEPPGPVRLRTQVHHRWVRLAVQVFEPVGTLADPLHLVIQTPGDRGSGRNGAKNNGCGLYPESRSGHWGSDVSTGVGCGLDVAAQLWLVRAGRPTLGRLGR